MTILARDDFTFYVSLDPESPSIQVDDDTDNQTAPPDTQVTIGFSYKNGTLSKLATAWSFIVYDRSDDDVTGTPDSPAVGAGKTLPTISANDITPNQPVRTQKPATTFPTPSNPNVAQTQINGHVFGSWIVTGPGTGYWDMRHYGTFVVTTPAASEFGTGSNDPTRITFLGECRMVA